MSQSTEQISLSLALRLLDSYLLKPLIVDINEPIRENIKIKLGELPDQIPMSLPLIDQVQVNASLQYKQDFFVILLQSSITPELVQNFYSNCLRVHGWLQWKSDESSEEMYPKDIYLPEPLQIKSRLIFFYRLFPIVLTLEAKAVSEIITDIKLQIFDKNKCPYPRRPAWEDVFPLPQIAMPPGAKTRNLRSSHRSDAWYQSYTIQTTLDTSLLFTHYNTQLSQLSWVPQASVRTNQLFWSVWILHDWGDTWQLFCSCVSNNNSSDRHAICLQMRRLNTFDQILSPTFSPSSLPTELIPADVLGQFLFDSRYSLESKKQLWVGKLPFPLPTPLKLPEQTQIVGSLVEKDKDISLFLTMPLSPLEIWKDLTNQFLSLGWDQSYSIPQSEKIGFITSKINPSQKCGFVHPARDSSCTITFDGVALSYTEVKLHWSFQPVETSETYLLEQSEIQKKLRQLPLPALIAPDQTDVMPIAFGYGGKTIESEVHIVTQLSSVELIEHYQLKIQQAGWQQEILSEDSNCHYSIWSFIDEQGRSWKGILSLLVNPERVDEYTGYICFNLLTGNWQE